MKITNTIIISIASILIISICSWTILRLHENSAENHIRIDNVEISDKDKIEMLVTLNSHRLELVKTIMDGDTIYTDLEMKFLDELLEKEGLEKFNKMLEWEVIDGYWKSKKAKSIIEHAIFLEQAMTDIVMNDSLLKMKLEKELGF
jgi:hypothetical protein